MRIARALLWIATMAGVASLLLSAASISVADSDRQNSASARRMQTNVLKAYLQLPLHFEALQDADANYASQQNRHETFVARSAGYSVYLTASGASFVLNGVRPARASSRLPQKQPPPETLRMMFRGTNPQAHGAAIDELPVKTNYLIGNDPGKWRTSVPNYAKVKFQGIYPGIDVVYYGNQGQIEYDFMIAAGGDPNAIAFDMRGTQAMRVTADGNLELRTRNGQLMRFDRPQVYQRVAGRKYAIDGRYRVTGNQIAFDVGTYDHAVPLVIDPVLVYSTYLGGSIDDYADAIAVDASGHAYVAGITSSLNFPTTEGSYQSASGEAQDAFVVKLSADGKSLVYSTYLGGESDDAAYALALDSSGHAYVAGVTSSANFPTTSGAYQTHPGGGPDAFIAKLSADGKSLVYSTLLGGGLWDQAYAIALDVAGNAYVAGYTNSPNFPTTAGAFQTTLGGGASDAFVAKLSADGKALEYATYLGGSGADVAYSLALDSSSHPYVVGYTNSMDFPTKNGAFQKAPGGGQDAFVTKLSADGKSAVYSTYLGGSSDDAAYSVAVDSSGHAYVAGFTFSPNFPATAGVYQAAFGGGQQDAFVSKLSPDGRSLVYSTYLGGSGNDNANAIAVDSLGRAYVVGYTSSQNFATTSEAYQAAYGSGPFDAFLARLSADGKSLLYSTYLGGSGADYINAIALGASGDVYLTGITTSTNFPTTPAAVQVNSGGGQDAFITKLNLATPIKPAAAPQPTKRAAPGSGGSERKTQN